MSSPSGPAGRVPTQVPATPGGCGARFLCRLPRQVSFRPSTHLGLSRMLQMRNHALRLRSQQSIAGSSPDAIFFHEVAFHVLSRAAPRPRPTQPLPAVRPRLASRDLREDGGLRGRRHQPRPRGFGCAGRQGRRPQQHHCGDPRRGLGEQDAQRADQRAGHAVVVPRRRGPARERVGAAGPDHDPEGGLRRRSLCRGCARVVRRGREGPHPAHRLRGHHRKRRRHRACGGNCRGLAPTYRR
jgi:hypothetical protein